MEWSLSTRERAMLGRGTYHHGTATATIAPGVFFTHKSGPSTAADVRSGQAMTSLVGHGQMSLVLVPRHPRASEGAGKGAVARASRVRPP